MLWFYGQEQGLALTHVSIQKNNFLEGFRGWQLTEPIHIQRGGGGVDSALLSMFAPLIFQTFHHFTKQAHLLGGALNLLMYFYSQLSGDQNDVVNFEWFLMSFYFLGLERKVVTLIPTIARFRVKSGFFSQGIHHFHFFVKWQDLVLLQICWEGGTYLGIPLFFHFYGDQSNSLCLLQRNWLL